jgi:hypothetical protein
MDMQSVDSSMIAAVGYDAETETMRVKMVNGGAEYDYSPVNPTAHRTLMMSSSKGKALNSLGIKGVKV